MSIGIGILVGIIGIVSEIRVTLGKDASWYLLRNYSCH